MPREFDPTLKALVEVEPSSWLPLVGQPPRPCRVIDADVSAILSGAADKFLHVQTNPEYVLHLDFQAGHDAAQLSPRLRLHNAVADYRTGLPEADSPQLTRLWKRVLPGEEPEETCRYRVVRVWQLPVTQLLTGGLGRMPLAPISNVRREQLPDVIRQMRVRLRRERQARELWMATRVLLGLRYPRDVVDILLRGVLGMKESSTYQAIVEEGRLEGVTQGRAEGMRNLLLAQGEAQFGQPDEQTRASILEIADVERLQELGKRVLHVRTWRELLAQAPPRRQNGRRRSRS